ncbi:MAG: NAD(P)H-hydrate dehydratase [Pseudomonadota bacterium]
MEFLASSARERALLSPAAMAVADQRAIDAGTPRGTLVSRAARACFRILRSQFTRRPVTVLCGPGNNGEDGLMLAALLAEADWPLTVVDLDGASHDDHATKRSLASHLRPSGTFFPKSEMLVVDALFGAGLTRAITGEAAALVQRVAESDAKVLAMDLPSGLDGATGQVRGVAAPADVTVTFHRLKPGHLLEAGPALCGRVFLCDIGIAAQDDDATALWNDPLLWADAITAIPRDIHKYARGHTVVIGGPGLRGGAGRLAARAASVSGAGAVTYFTPVSAAQFAASQFDAVMVRSLTHREALDDFLRERATSVVIGPGLGHSERARDLLDAVLGSGLPCVLDADALTLDEASPDNLYAKLHDACVLTPHEGEFARLFAGLSGDKLSRTQEASSRAGATVLLKGPATVIAKPDACPVINTHSAPELATAGSGDVLAGLIGGFLSQGHGPLRAASAGAWIHGAAAQGAGPGLNAEALPSRIADVLSRAVSVISEPLKQLSIL